MKTVAEQDPEPDCWAWESSKYSCSACLEMRNTKARNLCRLKLYESPELC